MGLWSQFCPYPLSRPDWHSVTYNRNIVSWASASQHGDSHFRLQCTKEHLFPGALILILEPVGLPRHPLLMIMTEAQGIKQEHETSSRSRTERARWRFSHVLWAKASHMVNEWEIGLYCFRWSKSNCHKLCFKRTHYLMVSVVQEFVGSLAAVSERL